MMKKLFRWLYRRSHGYRQIAPMIDGPLLSRLVITTGAVTDGPRSALS